MKKSISILWLLCLSLFSINSIAQLNELQFHNISTEKGLSQSRVNCIFKDHQGFMWFGTQDGLNRFDGFEFKSFFHEPDDSTSLSNNYIWNIYEDSQNNLWIGTFGGGLCLFDRNLEQFKTFYPHPPSESTLNERSVKNIMEHPEGTLWIGTHSGVSLFDINQMEFVQHPSQLQMFSKEALKNYTDFLNFNSNRILLVSGKNLFLIHLDTGKARRMLSGIVEMNEFVTIANNKNNQFWINTLGSLLLGKYDQATDSIHIIRKFNLEDDNSSNISDNIIQDIHSDKNGLVWFGTMKGLNVLDLTKENAGFLRFNHDKYLPNSLPSDFVYDIYEDDSDNIWLGTSNGISRFSILTSPFQKLSFANNGKGLCGSTVLGLQEDNFGNLWVGTREGLSIVSHFKKSQNNWQFNCYTPTNRKEIENKYILGISKDRSGGLWLCYRRNGFARVIQTDETEWKLESFSDFIEPGFFQNYAVNAIYEDRFGKFWIATSGRNLIQFDPVDKSFEIFESDPDDSTKLSHPYIYSILEDSKDNFWVGTAAGGLCKMDRKKGTFTCFVHDVNNSKSISHNMVPYIFEDSRERLWICTANGLNLMDSTGGFKRFSKKDGLPNDFIYGMLEDKNGHLWVSTNNGISRVSYENGFLKTENFNSENGLLGTEFNQNSYYKTKDNRLCFGSTKGLSIFDPDQIKPYPHPPKMAFTDFLIFNESVPVLPQGGEKERFGLPQSINETNEINLKYNQNFLAFEFAALGFTQPEKNQYAYLMEGVDPDWVMSKTRRMASYPNLKPGNYTFKVKAANHEGVWNEKIKSLKIIIAPPLWKTWWAYLIYLGLIILTIYGIIWSKVQTVRRVEEVKKEEREFLRKRIARDFHDEAGNKITKIALLTEIVKRNVVDKNTIAPMIDQIEDKVQELRSGMLDFVWVLDPGNDNLYETLIRLKEFGNNLFEYSNIDFNSTSISESLINTPLQSHQRRHLLLIFKEALNNSLKYSRGTQVDLEIIQEDEALFINLMDNGRGFNLNSVKKGSGLRNMKERAIKMEGDLTINTEPGKGTLVCLKIRITHKGD